MIESISQNLNIPKINGEFVNGADYGKIKLNFIKCYGSLSNYNIPWEKLKLKNIDICNVAEYYEFFVKNIFVLLDLPNTPIYKCDRVILDQLFDENMKPYDIDIYTFDEQFKTCIVYKGLFDKKMYIINP